MSLYGMYTPKILSSALKSKSRTPGSRSRTAPAAPARIISRNKEDPEAFRTLLQDSDPNDSKEFQGIRNSSSYTLPSSFSVLPISVYM